MVNSEFFVGYVSTLLVVTPIAASSISLSLLALALSISLRSFFLGSLASSCSRLLYSASIDYMIAFFKRSPCYNACESGLSFSSERKMFIKLAKCESYNSKWSIFKPEVNSVRYGSLFSGVPEEIIIVLLELTLIISVTSFLKVSFDPGPHYKNID